MEYLRTSLGVHQDFLEYYVELSFSSNFTTLTMAGIGFWCMKENVLLNTPWDGMITHVNSGMGGLHRHNETNVV